MKQYHDFLKHILDNGIKKGDRTGTGIISAIVPPTMRFDLSEGFPIVTTKEVNMDNIKHELKWFTKGDTNIKYLLNNGVNIWNGDAYRWYKEKGGTLTKKEFINKIKTDSTFAAVHGDLGPIYGAQWRAVESIEFLGDDSIFGGIHVVVQIDQLRETVEAIKEVAAGDYTKARRLLLTAWNPRDLEQMALPPCHDRVQFFVVGNKLSCWLTQRSGDAFLGIPYNISSYALKTHIIANETGLEVGEFIHTVGDAHIYLNHVEQVHQQLDREPYTLPLLNIPDNVTIDNWDPNEVSLYRYKHHQKIKGELSV
jgi:thymidylate synthase